METVKNGIAALKLYWQGLQITGIFIIYRGVHFYFLKLKTVCSEMFVPKICGPVGKSLMVISLCIYIIYITLQYCDLIFNKYMELGNIYIEYNLGTLKNNSFSLFNCESKQFNKGLSVVCVCLQSWNSWRFTKPITSQFENNKPIRGQYFISWHQLFN